jgi:GDP-mannose 6-dehydrogenase
MRVSIFGAGYVGCVSAACLVDDGFSVIIVDPDTRKIAEIAGGNSPIYEPGLDKIISQGAASGKLQATHDFEHAIRHTDISLCCPGTPSREDGSLETSFVETVAVQIGGALKTKNEFHTIVVRSTVLPGTVENVVIPALEKYSGKQAGVDFGVAYYPEFLREGTAIADYRQPGAIVFGQFEDDVRAIEHLVSLCANIPVQPWVIPLRSAEIVKYANNCWHAVKISFSNEIGNLCKSANIDSHEVMDVLCSDTRLNISKAYMKPGFAYGGSCLPKDLRALRHFGKLANVATPVLDAAVEANERQLSRAIQLVKNAGNRKIGILGITFKADTDDLRESPMVSLAESLLGTGYELAIFDPNISAENVGGRNYITHLAGFMKSTADEVVSTSDTIVIGNNSKHNHSALTQARGIKKIIDLVRVAIPMPKELQYEGLVW